MSSMRFKHENMSVCVSVSEEVTLGSGPSSPSITACSSTDAFFSSYSKRNLPFHILLSKVSHDKRIAIKSAIEQEHEERMVPLKVGVYVLKQYH